MREGKSPDPQLKNRPVHQEQHVSDQTIPPVKSLTESRCPGYSRNQRDVQLGQGCLRNSTRVPCRPSARSSLETRKVPVDSWKADLDTHSHINVLPANDRKSLLSDLEEVLRGAFPVVMQVPYQTRLWTSRRDDGRSPYRRYTVLGGRVILGWRGPRLLGRFSRVWGGGAACQRTGGGWFESSSSGWSSVRIGVDCYDRVFGSLPEAGARGYECSAAQPSLAP